MSATRQWRTSPRWLLHPPFVSVGGSLLCLQAIRTWPHLRAVEAVEF
jgi:hypothetical protein